MYTGANVSLLMPQTTDDL